MKKRNARLLALALALVLTACAAAPAPETRVPEETDRDEEEKTVTVTMTVGDRTFRIILDSTDTTQALTEKLPLTLSMSELNGNEKYNYLPFTLPTHTYSPGEIRAGDVMLFGSDCLVVFYESFSTPYSYTYLGHIEDISALKAALGTGNVTVTFE